MIVADHRNINSNFRLNGLSFQDADAILEYTRDHLPDCRTFLKAWFNKERTIEVPTSGATGESKIIRIKKEHMQHSALATGDYFNLKSGTRALLCMSPNYIAGKMMLVRALLLGWELDVVPPSSDPLSATTKNYDFTAMVPLQVQHSLNHLKRIDVLLVGGSPLSSVLKKKLQDIDCRIYESYGMTETVTHIAVRHVNDTQDSKNPLFNVLPNVAISTDARGCLVVKAPHLSNDIVVTNDLVNIESKGEFDLLGRADNIVNSGGIKLIPEQIENKLSDLIEADFFVAGIKDEMLGEKLVLIVEGKILPDNLEAKINELGTLTKYEIPKAIYNLPKFRRTSTGKVKRKETVKLL